MRGLLSHLDSDAPEMVMSSVTTLVALNALAQDSCPSEAADEGNRGQHACAQGLGPSAEGLGWLWQAGKDPSPQPLAPSR